MTIRCSKALVRAILLSDLKRLMLMGRYVSIMGRWMRRRGILMGWVWLTAGTPFMKECFRMGDWSSLILWLLRKGLLPNLSLKMALNIKLNIEILYFTRRPDLTQKNVMAKTLSSTTNKNSCKNFASQTISP